MYLIDNQSIIIQAMETINMNLIQSLNMNKIMKEQLDKMGGMGILSSLFPFGLFLFFLSGTRTA